MKQTDCPLCGSNQKTVVRKQLFRDDYLDMINPDYQKVERFIVSCDGCGFTYRDPALDEKDLQILYAHFRDMSLRNESPDEYFNRITNLPAKESENTVKVEWLKGNLEKRLAYPGKILDIGCGGGVFLYTFNKLIPGWKLHGIATTSSFAE